MKSRAVASAIEHLTETLVTTTTALAEAWEKQQQQHSAAAKTTDVVVAAATLFSAGWSINIMHAAAATTKAFSSVWDGKLGKRQYLSMQTPKGSRQRFLLFEW